MPGSFQLPAKRPISSIKPADPLVDDSVPPPAYDSPEIWNNGQQQPSHSSYTNEKTGPAPQAVQSPSFDQPSSYSTQQHLQQRPDTHLLHIYRDSLLGRDLTILDSDKTTVAYTIAANHGTIFSEKPHMRFYRGPAEPQPSSQLVGTATFHSYSRTVDLTLHNRAVSMESTSMFGYTHEFQSGIGPLLWKSNGWGSDLILMTRDKQWLAKFDARTFSVDKRGTLEIVNWDIQDVGLDEIVVSGMAMMEHMRRRRLARVAKSIYESCKVGPAEYKELCDETKSLGYALESLSDDAREPSSILNRKGIQRKGELDELISSCKSTMMDLQIIVDRHSRLRPDHRGNITRIWDAYQVGSIDLDSYRGKLAFHTSTIGVFLLSLQGPAMGRIENKLDKIYARIIRDDIDQAHQSTVSLASTVSVLSQIDTNEDEVFAMLKAELLTEDISMARILAHKDDIISHMKKLLHDGSAGDTGNEWQSGLFYQQSRITFPSNDEIALGSSNIELWEQLEASHQARQELKAQLEIQEQKYGESMSQIESDYQSAISYVKGTETMLRRVIDELYFAKKHIERLQSELETTKSVLSSVETPDRDLADRSLDHALDAGREQGRQSLYREIVEIWKGIKAPPTDVEFEKVYHRQ